jgi:RNA polymerase sigma factor (sigma-70 family)
MADARLGSVLRQIHRLAAVHPRQAETDQELVRRFTTTKDRQAFETLVRRHGSLVLSVCRRVLRQEQDAEDAFQATFLVLARKAASIRDAGALASWLYGVAYRMARSAKRAAGRRRTHEARAEALLPKDPSWETAWREVQTVLDDEIGRLPERLRAPFLLCYLEGHGRAEAARQLGLKEGTVWSRLAQARKQLQRRLGRRGIALSAVLGAAALSERLGTAAVPALLAAATARAAADGAADVSANVAALVEQGVRALAPAKLKLALALTLTAVLLAAGAVVLARPAPTMEPPAPEVKKGEEENRALADRYGDPLPEGAVARLGTVRLRHKEGGSGVLFAADGRQLITSANDGTVRFWDLNGGKQLLTLRSVQHGVSALALSPDGKLLAAADGNALRLWDAQTGRELRTIPGATDFKQPAPLIFAPDSATVAAVAKDGSIRLYEVATGKEQRALPPQAEGVRCLAFTADGKGLVSAGGEGQAGPLRVWELPSGKLGREVVLQSPQDSRIRPLALSADGQTLAVECAGEARVNNPRGGITVSTQYRLCLWDVAAGRERLRTEGGPDVLWSAAFSADGKSVAEAGMGLRVSVWDTTTGKPRVHLDGYPGGSRPDALGTLAFSADGKRLASVGDAAAVHVWDLTTGKEVASLPEAHQAALAGLIYSPDGRTVVTVSDDHTVRLWEAATGRQQRLLKGHTAAVRGLAFAPGGQTLVSADHDGVLRLWDVATGKELRTIETVARTAGVYFGICPVAFSPDGKTLASWGDDRRLHILDVATGKEQAGRPVVLSGLPPVPAGRPNDFPSEEVQIQAVALSPDARTAAAAVRHALYLVDVATGQELLKLHGHGGPVSLAFAPDGRTLASGGWDKTVQVWDVASGKLLVRVEGLDFVNAVAVAPDGRTAAAATGWANGAIVLLDVRTGQTLLRLQGHESFAATLAFAPDGKTLASGQRDTTALVWDLAPGLRRLGPPARELSREELEACWTDLAGADARQARVAVAALAGSPAAAVPFLKSRLRPIEWAKPEHVQHLLADLDSAEFATRDAARRELAALGVEAEAALRRALKSDLSVEARRRIEALLEGPAPCGVASGELLRRLRAVHVLEQVGSREAVFVLKDLAAGAPSARETQEAAAAAARLVPLPG